MTEFFVSVVNMSISAGWIVLAVLLLRLLLKKAPKWITVLLWGIVAVRLICPFTVESALSLIPSAQTINPEVALNPPAIDSGVPVIDNIVNPVIGGATISFQPEKDLNFFKFIMPYLAGLWLVGIAVLLVYTVVSYVRVKRKISTAVLLRDNIFQSESVVSPFVLGIIKPKIYLPFNMNEQDMEHVIAHEQAHIRRKDHWWKPFGFLLLTIHWFNPLMWLGYVLLCRDIELACDEKVIKELNTEQKADYSQALLTCSVNRRMIAACPLAFGEVGVKNRVKSVLNYKKPAFWIIVVDIVASIIAAVCFLTNPVNNTKIDDQLKVFLDMKIAEHMKTEHTGDNFIAVDYEILHVDSWLNDTTIYAWVLYEEYSYDGKINLEVGAHLPSVISVTKNDGKYTDDMSYWTPRDGSLYEEDIKSMFPRKLWSKALDSQRYINKQKANCENAAREYFSSITNVGGADDPNNVIVGTTIDQLKEKYPQFFNVSTDGGLKVYIWQMSKDNYQCYLVNRIIDMFADQSFAFEVGTTIAEMRAILTTYDIDQKDITIHPVNNPLSSYYYEITDAYRSEVTELFCDENIVTQDALIGKPPAMTVRCGKSSVDAWLGTYSWMYKNFEDGTAQSTNADSSHPLTRIDEIPTLNILSTTMSAIDPRLATVQFAVAPDKIEVKCYKVDEKNTNSGKAIPVEGTSFKLKDGKYLYEVIVEWTKSEQYSGKAYYAFQAADADLEIVDINGVTSTDTNLMSAISSVLNEKYNKAGKPDGLIHFENYCLLANETASGTPLKGNSGHMEEATVYLLVYHMKYSVNGGQLEEVEGDFVPTSISFKIDENGQYTLKEYWTPRSGANYEKDVLGKFPGASATDVLNTEQYAEDLIKENWRLAKEYIQKINGSS